MAHRLVQYCKFLVFVAVLPTAARQVIGAEPPSERAPVVPCRTKVLLLQPIDATVDSAVLQPLRQQIIRLAQQYEFISRQFAVLGEKLAARAALEPPAIDLEGTAGRSAAMIDELARRAGADWVVSITVKEIKSDPSRDGDFMVHSTLLVQLRDAKWHSWLLQRVYVGHLSGGGSPGWLFVKSLEGSTRDALAEVLAAYPPVISVSRDGSIVDYLDGQTTLFIGNPNMPTFRGLKNLKANCTKPDLSRREYSDD